MKVSIVGEYDTYYELWTYFVYYGEVCYGEIWKRMGEAWWGCRYSANCYYTLTAEGDTLWDAAVGLLREGDVDCA